jgi:Cof subfamily protein (haloacid dehalogenase superfamily)
MIGDMIKLLVTDVDGTLLDNNSELPDFNKKALIKCLDRKIEVILATGKSFSSVFWLIKLLGLKMPQITLNGSVIVNKDCKVISFVRINPGYYHEIIADIRNHDCSPLVALADGRVLYDNEYPAFEIFRKINEKIFRVKDIDDEEYCNSCVDINAPIKETDPLDAYLRNKYEGKLQLVRSGEYFFDILNLEATKGNALKQIAQELGLRKEEIAVFGDSYNDLSMFDQSGLRIAVKNSYKKVLEAADFITDENNNCGLGKAIYKYILKD